MKINMHSLLDGGVVATDVSGLSFGTVRKGQHCGSPVLVKFEKTVESEILGLRLFLQGLGGLTGASFGYYVSSGFTGGIDYTNLITNHFEISEGATGRWPHGVTGSEPPYWGQGVDVGVTGDSWSDLVWLDVEIGLTGQVGSYQPNYTVVYDYN